MATATTIAASETGNVLLSSEDLESTPVFGGNGEKIGTIDHLMVHRESGQVIYAVVTFGGFLGLAQSHYPVPWHALKYSYEKKGYLTNIDEKSVRDAPEFSDDGYGDQTWACKLDEHYGRNFSP